MIARQVRSAVFLTTLVGSGCAPSAPPSADLLLHNARVFTVDGSFSIAEAVAISGDRIVAVGDSASIRALAGADTRVIDLGGRAVIPGLMDNHLHGAGGGPGVDLSRARSLDESVRRHSRAGQRHATW